MQIHVLTGNSKHEYHVKPHDLSMIYYNIFPLICSSVSFVFLFKEDLKSLQVWFPVLFDLQVIKQILVYPCEVNHL